MKVIIDSDSLIKLTRAKVKEIVVENMDLYIPIKVYEETVTIPKKEGFPDAFLIEENLKKGLLILEEIDEDQHIEEMVTSLGMGYGEADVFRLYKSGNFDVISSDDRRFLKTIDALNLPYLTSTALIVYLFNKKVFTKSDALSHLNNLKDMVSDEEYYLAIKEVE